MTPPRTWRSSCCASSFGCCAARPAAPSSPHATESCSPRQPRAPPQAVGVVARHPQTLLRSPRPRATNVEPSQGTHAGPTTDRPRDRGTQPAAGAAEPAMGCVRISGALRKLGIRVGATTTGTTLRRHGLSPAPRRSGPTWARFLPAQAEAIVACDFLHGGDDPAQDAVDAVVRPAQQQTGHRCRRHGQP